MLQAVLGAYGLHAEKCKIEPFGSGLINHTWKVYHESSVYILQEVNTLVFRQPQYIAQNIRAIKEYLNETAPGYLFVAPINTLNGDDFVAVYDHFYRIFPFIAHSCTIDFVQRPEHAYQAAKQFGQFSRMLCAFDVQKLKATIEDFHNLPLRVGQFKKAVAKACDKRISDARFAIKEIIRHDD
ncbi:MAG: aminoglycoside phosphotransferase family protein, partial [Pedobacter terrae]